jgi:hypothetical protein
VPLPPTPLTPPAPPTAARPTAAWPTAAWPGPLAAAALLLLGGCVPISERSSGRVFPLPRHDPHDGLAVVTRPGGEGLHIYLDTDTSAPGDCAPRWHVEAARLVGGDGPSPRSGGRVAAAEFFTAVRRGRVRQALRREVEALCRARAPRRGFVWQEPPRQASEVRLDALPPLEEEHLLSHPTAVRRAEKQLLGLPLSPDDLVDKRLPRPPDGP